MPFQIPILVSDAVDIGVDKQIQVKMRAYSGDRFCDEERDLPHKEEAGCPGARGWRDILLQGMPRRPDPPDAQRGEAGALEGSTALLPIN